MNLDQKAPSNDKTPEKKGLYDPTSVVLEEGKT